MSDERKKSKRNMQQKYSIWKYRIRALLAEEDALKVLNEEPPAVLNSEWKRRERFAKGIVSEYLTNAMLCFSTENDTAKNIIEKLDSIYERKILATQLAIEKKLLYFKFKEDTPLMKHLISFDEMIVELQAAGATINEMSKVARLLLTLPNSYDPLVTAIQTQADENLRLAFVKIELLDYEAKIRNEKAETSAKVLHVKIKSDNYKTRRNEEQILTCALITCIGNHHYKSLSRYRGSSSITGLSLNK